MSHEPPIPDALAAVCDRALGEDVQGAIGHNGVSRAVDSHDPDVHEFEMILGALSVGLMTPEPMPAGLRARLDRRIDDLAPPALRLSGSPGRATPEPRATISIWRPLAITGWAAAAVLAIVVTASILTSPREAAGLGSLASARERLIAAGVQPVAWSTWSDESVPAAIEGVSGDVVWDDERQEGYMRFTGLTPNDPGQRQYQLWILDGRYENPLEQRVSGGVFDVTSDGEVIVPIRQWMAIDKAVGFAVTIERPGGVWISDMSQRVVIALKQT